MLAADADVQLGVVCTAVLDGIAHQLANAGLIQLGEGIVLENLGIVVSIQELTGIVTGEAVGHLGQVVGAEAEEVGVLGDLVSGQAGTGNLDHGADLVLKVNASSGDFRIGGLHDNLLDVLQLLDVANQGDHDFGNHIPLGVSLLHIDGSADNRGGLHFGNLSITYFALLHSRWFFANELKPSRNGNPLLLGSIVI